MGSLRIESREKPPLTDAEYENYYQNIKKARDAAEDNHIYWDLDSGEKAAAVRRAFLYVAESENIDLTVRKVRGTASLLLSFSEKSKVGRKRTSGRMSAETCRELILETLANSDGPLQKGDILKATGISASSWNLRIRELLASGEVSKEGDRRDTRYELKKR